ncbi:MAG: cupin domain-containing protein [Comamonadaceae bacterium]|nr:cupin domain-containing protein [Comamonadaceae bacterium]
MRYPRGWSRLADEFLTADEEFYVLDGAIEINGSVYLSDHYGHVPKSVPRRSMSTQDGAVVLTFFDAEPAVLPAPPGPPALHGVVHRDVLHMPWDMNAGDRRLPHAAVARRTLRADAHDNGRSFLSMMLPQADLPGTRGPRETHPLVQECYVLSGSLAGPQGQMHAGAYYWRPAGVAHGLFATRWGCVALVRTIGSHRVDVWSMDEAPLDFHAPYRPILPPALAPLAALVAATRRRVLSAPRAAHDDALATAPPRCPAAGRAAA